MCWLDGVVQCAPLSAACVLDWDALAAIATSAAVVVAMIAIKSENKHRNMERNRADEIRLQELTSTREREIAELNRQEESRKSKARRLAKIFDRELTEAARELLALIKLIGALNPNNEDQFREIYGKPLNKEVFQMHDRFIDQLDVFPDDLAIEIVNNRTNWSSITLFSEGLDTAAGIDLVRIRPKLLAEVKEVVKLMGETKDKLHIYFADLPGIQVFTVEEIRAFNAQKAEEEAKRLNAAERGGDADKQ
jgi:hypothetical protein